MNIDPSAGAGLSRAIGWSTQTAGPSPAPLHHPTRRAATPQLDQGAHTGAAAATAAGGVAFPSRATTATTKHARATATARAWITGIVGCVGAVAALTHAPVLAGKQARTADSARCAVARAAATRRRRAAGSGATGAACRAPWARDAAAAPAVTRAAATCPRQHQRDASRAQDRRIAAPSPTILMGAVAAIATAGPPTGRRCSTARARAALAHYYGNRSSYGKCSTDEGATTTGPTLGVSARAVPYAATSAASRAPKGDLRPSAARRHADQVGARRGQADGPGTGRCCYGNRSALPNRRRRARRPQNTAPIRGSLGVGGLSVEETGVRFSVGRAGVGRAGVGRAGIKKARVGRGIGVTGVDHTRVRTWDITQTQ